MKKKALLEFLPYVIITVCAFYLFPIFIKDTGSAIFVLLALIPVTIFANMLVCGIRKGFKPLLSLAVGVLFLPSIFIFYNGSALIYSPVYFAIAIIGIGIGALMRKIFIKK